jgi:hypothetical protein
MAWYRCECGYLADVTPRPGNVIASVNHLHRSARVDGTSVIVRMEESRTPITGDAAGEGEPAEQQIAA